MTGLQGYPVNASSHPDRPPPIRSTTLFSVPPCFDTKRCFHLNWKPGSYVPTDAARASCRSSDVSHGLHDFETHSNGFHFHRTNATLITLRCVTAKPRF
jgi:hypothetical protein